MAALSKATTTSRRSFSAKADPVIDMIARAGTLLDEHTAAAIKLELAKAKLSDNDRRWPSVLAPEGLWSGWNYNFRFTSEHYIDAEFKRVIKRARDEIKAARGKTLPSQLNLERQQRISRNQMLLASLPKFREPLKKAFRAEERRLARVQKKVGLPGRHKEKNKAWLGVHCTRSLGRS